MALLEVDAVQSYYGNIQALKGVSLSVDKGEIVTLIGANGAGKSTTLKTISGSLQPRHGEVRLRGESLLGVKAHDVVRRGIIHVPEGRGIFGRLSVEENLQVGAYVRNDNEGIAEDLDQVYTTFPRLAERRKQSGGTLSGGEQQMLAIGRGLMAKPQPPIARRTLHGPGPHPGRGDLRHHPPTESGTHNTTILLVEQNAKAALEVAHRGYVLETGHIELEGPAKDLLNDKRVMEAYLGV